MNSLNTVLYFLVFISFIHSLKASCVPSETTATVLNSKITILCSGDLIFEDNFDTLDSTKWMHDITLAGGGNWEFQYYLNNRTNSFVEDGNLHIKPTYLSDDTGEDFLYSGTLDLGEACTNGNNFGCNRTGTASNILNPIKSAKIRSPNSFTFKYGTVEVRAKMPTGDWLWPAIWLMPKKNAYGSWPTSGEIDLVESRGNKAFIDDTGVNVGSEQVSQTLHWGPNPLYNQFNKTHWIKNNAAYSYDSKFHTFKLVWTSNKISFYVDDELTGSITPPNGGFWILGDLETSGLDNPWINGDLMAPFDQEFYLIINLAVGGITFFSDDYTNPGGKPWKNDSPTTFKEFWEAKSQWEPTWDFKGNASHLIVDYIRVYAI